MIISLSPEQWEKLAHAYGSASDVPQRIKGFPSEETWDFIWSALFHQGTVYSASFPAVLLLDEQAENAPYSDQLMFLGLLGLIESNRAHTYCPDEFRHAHSLLLAKWRTIAVKLAEAIPTIQNFWYLMESLAALNGSKELGRSLSQMVDGELNTECPNCRADLLISVGKSQMKVFEPDTRCMPLGKVNSVSPVSIDAPTGLVEIDKMMPIQWMLYFAKLNRGLAVSQLICSLFGEAECPSCSIKLSPAVALAAAN